MERAAHRVMRPTESAAVSSVADRIRALGLQDEDVESWAASGLPEEALDDWLTDRIARKPGGAHARRVYGADDAHDFARRAILEALRLEPGDRLLDIGCGGGLLLRDATATGADVTGLDHSRDMVDLARDRAPGATIVLGDARHLPFTDGSFTAVSMSVVFFFLDDPIGVLHECRRVLRPTGRLAVYTRAPELRGTPAAPEPVASRGHFYTDEELAGLARQAGLVGVTVERDDGAQLLIARAS